MSMVKDFKREVDEACRKLNRINMPEPKMLVGEICWELDKDQLSSSWTKHKVVSGLEKEFYAKLGFEKCKKSEATILFYVGEQVDGFFIKDKTKRFWLRNTN